MGVAVKEVCATNWRASAYKVVIPSWDGRLGSQAGQKAEEGLLGRELSLGKAGLSM